MPAVPKVIGGFGGYRSVKFNSSRRVESKSRRVENESHRVENESRRVCNVKLEGQMHGVEFRINR